MPRSHPTDHSLTTEEKPYLYNGTNDRTEHHANSETAWHYGSDVIQHEVHHLLLSIPVKNVSLNLIKLHSTANFHFTENREERETNRSVC